MEQIERRWFDASIRFRAMVGFLNGEILKQKYKSKTKMNGSLFLKHCWCLIKGFLFTCYIQDMFTGFSCYAGNAGNAEGNVYILPFLSSVLPQGRSALTISILHMQCN